MSKLTITIISLTSLALILALIGLRMMIGCGGNIVCHATEDYPPHCGENGETFILLKNQGASFYNNPIPDGAFYYLLPEGSEDGKGYGAINPIEVANYAGLNLEEFVDHRVCIEGKYRFGLPTYLVAVEDYPAGIGGYEQVVADITDIQLRVN